MSSVCVTYHPSASDPVQRGGFCCDCNRAAAACCNNKVTARRQKQTVHAHALRTQAHIADTHTCIVIKIGRDVDAFNGTLRPCLMTRDACAAQGVLRCV